MKREIKVGLTLISAILLLYLVMAWVTRSQIFAPEEKTYLVLFEQVNGLLEGDPVMVRGVISGRVQQISPKAHAVEVLIAVDAALSVFENARAEIQLKELMGGKQLSLYPGNQGNMLSENASFYGTTAMDFSSSFSRIGSIMDQFDGYQLTQLLVRLDTLTRTMETWMGGIDYNQLNRTFERLNSVGRNLDGLLGKLGGKDVMTRIDSGLIGLNNSMAQASSLLQRTEKLMTQVEEKSLPKADQALSQIPEILTQTKGTLSEVQQLLQGLNTQQGLAGRLLNDPSFGNKLDSTLYNLNKVLEQIHSQKIIVGFKRKKKDTQK